MDARKAERSVIEEERKEARGWINQRLYSSLSSNATIRTSSVNRQTIYETIEALLP